VPYAPGRLAAVGYRGGKVVQRFEVETTGAPVALRLTPDRPFMLGDGLDAQPIQVEALDAKGRHVPLAQHQIVFKAEGADIIGLGNGDPNDTSSEKGNTRALFNGLAQVIVQTREGSAGSFRLSASAAGLKPAVLDVEVRKARPWAYQATSAPVQVLDGWRSSPVSPAPVDPNLRPAATDMNSWGWVTPGTRARPAEQTGYVLYAADVRAFARVRKHGGRLEFVEVTGPCQVYIDGRKVAEKTTDAPAALRVPFPPGEASIRLSVLCPLTAGQAHGLSGVVRLSSV
jgi:beta-galactosidase